MNKLYNASIDIETGRVSPAPWTIDSTTCIPLPETTIHSISVFYDWGNKRIDVASFISHEHAIKVGMKKREEILRFIGEAS